MFFVVLFCLLIPNFSVAIFLGDKWEDNTLKCGRRYCFGCVEHTILSAKYNLEHKARAALTSSAGARSPLGHRHTYVCIFLSLYALGKIFSERFSQFSKMGNKNGPHTPPEIAFHSITRSISSDGKEGSDFLPR